ncbi:hypothetical protein G9A89_018698 [Geosiphon pyriformis]|nr:hypothetical protein G9A89_018698 [Geosiphon pyriformis]
MDLKTASSSDMSKKKALKSTLHGLADGFFFQKKKVVLDNIKHSGDKKDISLVKLGSGSMYSDINSESSCGEDNTVIEGINSGLFLGLAATTSKAKKVNSSMVFGSPLGSFNYKIEEEIDLKIVKTSVEVSVRKLFALDINLLAVEGKFATAKTQFIKKIFSPVNGFGRATIPLKFEGIIQSMFTSEKSMKMAISLAREKGININSDLKRQEMRSDRTVVIKEIFMNTPKDMIIVTVSEFGEIKSIKIQLIRMWQKAVVEFAELDQADLLVSKWLFLIGKNSVCIAKAVEDHETWASKDQFRMLLFTLPVKTTAHNLGTLLDKAGEKTCVINRSLETGNRIYCAVVGFEFENDLESAFCIEPILGGIKLFWARIDLVQCEKYRKFGHSAMKYNAFIASLSKPSRTFKRVVSDGHHF